MELGLSLLLFALNGILSSSDVVSVIGWLSTNYLKKDPTVQSEAPSKPRVEEAMQRLTEENFLIASHFLQHAMLLAVIMYVGMGSPAFAGLCFLFYATFLLIAKGYVRMTSRRVKIYLIVNYITFIPVMFAGDLFAAVGRKEVLDQITSAYRFVLVVLCVDSNLHIPSQVAVSLAQVAFYVWNRGWDEPAVPFVFGQAFTAAMTSTLSFVLEYYLRQRLEAQFKSADAESITSGFRQMLRGVCDGEVLLNGSLEINGSSRRLSCLLSTQEELEGRSFQSLLLQEEDEQRRFNEFISRPSGSSEGMPACLRVSLCNAAATRVGVDVYHVALPCLYGSEEVYHLLALKEDQPQAIPEAIQDTPRSLLPTGSIRSVNRSASVPGEVSRVPRHRRLSMFDSDIPALPLSCLPQLSDIVMLLDSSSPQKDIKQLHMNYSRSKNGRSSADGMPSLRKLIRPTDWESVHASVTAYAAKCGRPSVSEKTLGPLCFRRPDGPHKFMVAKQARLYFSPNKEGVSSRLWLSLSSFALLEKRTEATLSELQSIGEQSEPDS